jgi:hypothetical protein
MSGLVAVYQPQFQNTRYNNRWKQTFFRPLSLSPEPAGDGATIPKSIRRHHTNLLFVVCCRDSFIDFANRDCYRISYKDKIPSARDRSPLFRHRPIQARGLCSTQQNTTDACLLTTGHSSFRRHSQVLVHGVNR